MHKEVRVKEERKAKAKGSKKEVVGNREEVKGRVGAKRER